jgi:XRE family transcriptional regulator, aerobic/anaerobic benzoate catabolism transcriptional regulator
MPETIDLPSSDIAVTQSPEFLRTLGERVRAWRARRGMTRKMLAVQSQVSERHLAKLESGNGNISVLLLQQIAGALNLPLVNFFQDDATPRAELGLIQQLLERLPDSTLAEIRQQLMRQHGVRESERRKRIALIGLRGAGKSSLGRHLADELNCAFVELDRDVEQLAGMGLSELFSLYGQSGYRRFERRALEAAISNHERVVVATGGSIVSESATFDFLLANCYTVWLKATPEEHMARVLAQGDLRPMAGNKAAMDDLKQILRGRAALYGKADHNIDTGKQSLEQTLAKLKQLATATKESQ